MGRAIWWTGSLAALGAIAAFSYWCGSRSQTLSAAGTVTAVAPERASAIILAPATLPRFFADVRRVEADPDWPAAGSAMTWWVGASDGFRFRARVTSNDLPRSLHTLVETPSSDSVITHRFEPDGSGGTRYEKLVELHYRGFWNRLLGPLVTYIVSRALPAEVARAAAAVGGS